MWMFTYLQQNETYERKYIPPFQMSHEQNKKTELPVFFNQTKKKKMSWKLLISVARIENVSKYIQLINLINGGVVFYVVILIKQFIIQINMKSVREHLRAHKLVERRKKK